MPYACRYATLGELRRLYAPGAERRWLAPREQQVCDGLHDPSRRDAWLAGRLLAKRLISDYLAFHRLTVPAKRHREVEIDSGQPGLKRIPPAIRIAGQAVDWSLSISHTRHGVLVALTDAAEIRVGVDLIEPTPCGPGFVKLWFTSEEQHWLRRFGQGTWPAILWAAKEAVFKATNQGEPFQPLKIEVLPEPNGHLVCTPLNRRFECRVNCEVRQTRQGEIAVVAVCTREGC
jgi:phosphopantetheinyl transferase